MWASVALLAGAVKPGLYGEYPSLAALDEATSVLYDGDAAVAVLEDRAAVRIAARALGHPPTRVLVLSASGEESDVLEAVIDAARRG